MKLGGYFDYLFEVSLTIIIKVLKMTETMFTAGKVNFFLGIAVSESEHADPNLKDLPSALS